MLVWAVYFLTTTRLNPEFVSNNAIAVIMAPIAHRACKGPPGVPRPPGPLVVRGWMIAASACFRHPPFGYQTNMLVYGPGGYGLHRFHQGRTAAKSLARGGGVALQIPFLWPLLMRRLLPLLLAAACAAPTRRRWREWSA